MTPVDRALLYLDDLRAGQIFPGQDSVLVDAAAIKAYARQFDPQPFHLDETAAADTIFGGLAASGWHTASITMRLMAVDGPPLAGGIVGGSLDELRWPKPVRPGDRLRIECEILEVIPSKSRPEQGRVKMRTTTFNQHDEPVQMIVANLIVPRRRQAAVG
ncbi:MAG TPA: MaoC family dehydratase [Pseudolabrys sp.]|nr:MaoC family dehydratase [Pseudolabrys sp.]